MAPALKKLPAIRGRGRKTLTCTSRGIGKGASVRKAQTQCRGRRGELHVGCCDQGRLLSRETHGSELCPRKSVQAWGGASERPAAGRAGRAGRVPPHLSLATGLALGNEWRA